MFHYNNRIGQNDSITKRGQNWIGDHKNHFNQDDIIMKRGENGILDDYFSLEGHNTLFIVYTSASIIMILPP